METVNPKETPFTKFKLKKLQEFQNEFMNVSPGDSGVGGNLPQEPVREFCTNDPDEIMIWVSKLMDEIKEEIIQAAYSCSNCGTGILYYDYDNQNPQSEKDEYFCNEECENEFHRKNA